jgi:hypothetical protein
MNLLYLSDLIISQGFAINKEKTLLKRAGMTSIIRIVAAFGKALGMRKLP